MLQHAVFLHYLLSLSTVWAESMLALPVASERNPKTARLPRRGEARIVPVTASVPTAGASSTRVSNALGAGRPRAARRTARVSGVLSVVSTSIAAGLILLFRNQACPDAAVCGVQLYDCTFYCRYMRRNGL